MTTPLPTLRLGTRGSLLARTQSQLVADAIQARYGGRVELVVISTAGDRQQGGALTDAGGKGLFVKEIEEAILDRRIDLAVHSAKDMPTEIPAGLVIAATPAREVPNDMWVGHNGLSIKDLPPGAVVGTTSLRRRAQLLALRPDLKTTVFRGNIDTRLRKVASGQEGVMGTFLAAAGLRRTGLVPGHAQLLALESFIPAAGQGTLALECRREDAVVSPLLAQLHDPLTFAALAFERHIVRTFAGSCLAPIGVCAMPRSRPEGAGAGGEPQEGWLVRAVIASPDGRQMARAALLTQDASAQGLEALGPLLIETLERRGAREILACAKGDETGPHF